MEMARVAHRLRVAVALLAVTGAVAGFGAGGCSKAACPSGTRADGKRSQPGVNAYCVSATDSTHTTYVQLHGNGGPRQVCPFVSGRASGAYQAFHPTGARWIEGRYENGFKIGRWTQWAPDGRKVADGAYRLGTIVEGAPVGFPATCETITW
jgi:hypothetical protein